MTGDAMKKGLISTAIILAILFATFSLLIVGSRWHISNPDLNSWVVRLHICHFMKSNYNIDWLPSLPKVIIKKRLGAFDALINLLAIFVTGAPTIIFYFFGLAICSIFFIFYGLFTGDWNSFLGGLMAVIITLLVPIIFGIYIFFLWIRLLFQPCTPGYIAIMLPLGLPVIFASFILGYGAIMASTAIPVRIIE